VGFSQIKALLPNDLVQFIQCIPIPYTEVMDSFCWGFTGSGDLSTSFATWKANDNLSKEQPIW